MNMPKNVELLLEKRANAISNAGYATFLCSVQEELDNLEEQETPMISPVEQRFFIEWQFQRHGVFLFSPSDRFELFPQYKDESTGNFRIDFSVDFFTGVINCPSDSIYFYHEKDIFKSVPAPRLGIEIDGHEWHEKTKDQARKDRSRERFLVGNGWKILHFTGSEVFRDAAKCVWETTECSKKTSSAYHKSIREYLGIKSGEIK